MRIDFVKGFVEDLKGGGANRPLLRGWQSASEKERAARGSGCAVSGGRDGQWDAMDHEEDANVDAKGNSESDSSSETMKILSDKGEGKSASRTLMKFSSWVV